MINEQRMRLFQFCDSQIPTGAFSHSFGLETYIQTNVVHDSTSFQRWLELFLQEQLVYSDGLAMRFIHEALEKEDFETIIYYDRLLYVQNLPRETRIGSKQMGSRMLKLSMELYDSEWLRWYSKALNEKKVFTHPAICFVMVGYYLGIDIETVIDYYLYQNISSLTQNAVRAIPLGQTDGQRIIASMIPEIKNIRAQVFKADSSEFGITAPGLEINQMEHEHIGVRIFIS